MSNRFTVADLLDDRVRINPAARAALIAFRRTKPWRGTFAERWDKFMALRQALSEAYGIAPILEFHGEERRDGVGNGAWLPNRNTIVLVGKLSVVTFLHCFGKARGMNHRDACRWSLNVFRKLFPLSFSRCRADGYCLIRN